MTEPEQGKRRLWRTIAVVAILTVALAASAGFWFYRNLHSRRVRPPVPLTERLVTEKPVSVFDLPVEIDLAVLAAYLNGKIQGDFLKTTLWLQQEHKELVSLTVSKYGPIGLVSNGKEVVCTVPLSIEARLLDSRLGKTLAKLLVSPVRARVVITLATPIGLSRDWRLTTRFRLRSIRWLEEPVVKIGPFRKNLTDKINEYLGTEKEGLTAMLDREIRKAADLEPTIAGVWSDLQEPILILRKPRPLWLRFVCDDIASHIVLGKGSIVCKTRIAAALGMLGDTTAIRPATRLPAFRGLKRGEWKGYSDINFFAVAQFAKINEELNRHFRGRTIRRRVRKRDYEVVVKEVRAFGSDRGLTIAVRTGRDIDSDVYVSGRPIYDVATGKLGISNFEYAIETGNPIIGTGDLVLHDMVRDSIASKLDYPVGHLVDRIPGIIHNAISKAKAGRTIDLRIDSLRIRSGNVRMGSENLYILVNLHAKTALNLKRIKPGKSIRIRK